MATSEPSHISVLALVRTGVPRGGDRAVTSYAMLRTTFMRSFCVLALALAACGTDDGGGDDGMEVDCATVTGVDTFHTDLEHAGGSGVFDFTMKSADPAPPARGNNTWVVQINAMNAGVVGAPVDGATFKVTPFMPAHQHGTGVPVEITPMTDGTYQLSPVNLWMQGVWETTIRATSSDGTATDSAVFKFCVD